MTRKPSRTTDAPLGAQEKSRIAAAFFVRVEARRLRGLDPGRSRRLCEPGTELATDGLEALGATGQLQLPVSLQRHRHDVAAERDVGIGRAFDQPLEPHDPRTQL